MFRDIVCGLKMIHDGKQMHRDLKPDNIFLLRTKDGYIAKLGDFGLSREVGTQQLASSLSKGVGS